MVDEQDACLTQGDVVHIRALVEGTVAHLRREVANRDRTICLLLAVAGGQATIPDHLHRRDFTGYRTWYDPSVPGWKVTVMTQEPA